MDLWELVAREQIRETLARYNHAGDRGRFDEMLDQFTVDGILEVPGSERLVGREAIREYLGGFAVAHYAEVSSGGDGGAPALVRHYAANVLIHEVNPTEARVDSYFLVILSYGVSEWGRYRDVLVPDGDRWRIAHRSVRVDGELAAPGT